VKLEEKHFEVKQAGREEVLGRVCAELGYCSLGDTYDRLLDDPPSTISEFVDAIIAGEGLNPETTPNRQKRRMRDMIIEVIEKHDGRMW
jgi:hypothetical protein